ncbi:MAG: hypothetical protein WEA04_04850 [Candidatus Andersenbacteria bacterium]
MKKKLPAIRIRMVGASLGRAARAVPQYLLFQHPLAVQVVLLLVGMGLGLYVVLRVLFTDPTELSLEVSQKIPQLMTEQLDELEFWIEEQHAAFSTPLPLGTRQYFQVIREGQSQVIQEPF